MSFLDFKKELMSMYLLDLTPWRSEFLDFWALQEGMSYDKTFNPFATTWLSTDVNLNNLYNIGYGPGNWNSVPVRVYASQHDGVKATFNTLQLSYYNNIRKAISEQKINPDIVGPKDFTSWVGSDAYGKAILAHMLAFEVKSGSEPVVTPVLDPVTELNNAVTKRLQLLQYCSRLETIALGDYNEMLKLHSQLSPQF